MALPGAVLRQALSLSLPGSPSLGHGGPSGGLPGNHSNFRVVVHREQAQNWNLPARQHSIPGEKRDYWFVLCHLHNLG